MIDATNILSAAFRYKRNRDIQKQIAWDKEADAQALMQGMLKVGLRGVHGIAGSYFGTTGSNRLFGVEIMEDKVVVGEFSGFSEMVKESR